MRDQAEESGPAQCNQRNKTNESAIMRESIAGAAARGSADQIHCTATAQLLVPPLKIIEQDTPCLMSPLTEVCFGYRHFLKKTVVV